MQRKIMIFALFLLVGTTLSLSSTAENNGPVNWAVYKNLTTAPHVVGVAPHGSMKPPWRLDGLFYDDAGSAWKKVCWYVRNGAISSQAYRSPQMESGRAVCDRNCNCRVDAREN